MDLSMMTRSGQMGIFVNIMNDEARGGSGDVLAYKDRVLARFLLALDGRGPNDSDYFEKLVSLNRRLEEKISEFLGNEHSDEGN